MSTNPTPDFSNDRPLTSGEHDRLNRAAFSKRIASVLLGLPNGTGLVVGIHGPWGDGKTTVLNMLRTELEASTDTVVVDFNPWRFTQESAMLSEFFRVLAEIIRARLTTRGEKIAGWIEDVGRYASVIDERFGRAAEAAAPKRDPGLEKLRERLSDALVAAKKRIVVLIDDIDRLDKHETHTLFRIIKACADFPNVCYVLAFDDTAVAKALGERYGGGDETSGRDFLEKIIQVPLKLPVAARVDLRLLCLEQVDKATASAGIELTSEQVAKLLAGFDHGISPRLTTPRAAKRYGNGLMFALPMLRGEADPVDLLLVEALRAFFPEIYDIVRNNHEEFSGVESENPRRANKEPRYAELLKPALDRMPADHSDAAKALLVDLFPRVSSFYGIGWGRGGYGSDWLLRWSREQRISSPEYCPRYFTYSVALNDVSDIRIRALLEAATKQDAASVEAWLATHLDGPKNRRVIEKLRIVEETTDPVAAEILALAISRLAKRIPIRLAPLNFAEPPAQAAILISHLLRRISDRTKRIAVAECVVRVADPLWFGAECVRWLYVTEKPEEQDSNTLTKEEVEVVRRALVERVKARAADGFPLFDPEVPQEYLLLFEWQQREGRDPVQTHLIEVFTKEPRQVARFLQVQAPLVWRGRDVLPRLGVLDTGHLRHMNDFIDLDVMAEWIQKQYPGNSDNPDSPSWIISDTEPLDQQLAKQFVVAYKQWKVDGDPPASPDSNSDEASGTKPDSN